MVTNIKGRNINTVVLGAIEELLTEGYETPSRNGNVHAIYNALLTLENPMSRHLNLKGRKNNIFATIAETFWVYSGSINVKGFLEFFLPRATDFADDGVNWYGGYGKRIYIYNQLEDVIQQFRNEGIFTRRANLYIGQPEFDSHPQLEANLCKPTTKDRPCNQLFNFFITPDKKLNMNGFSRSGDIIWGIGSINLFEFSYLQEFILQELKREIDNELKLGEYNHWVTNMHLYDFSGQQGKDALKLKDKQDFVSENDLKLRFPEGVKNFKEFHKGIVKIIEDKVIFCDRPNLDDILKELETKIEEYNIPYYDNLLPLYVRLVGIFAYSKKEGFKSKNKLDLNLDISGYPLEVQNSIINSVFRNFTIKDEIKEERV
jgi:thymidylate synthase